MPPRTTRFTLLAVALSVLLTACGVNPVTGKKEIQFVSEAQELQIGEKNYSPTRQGEGGDLTVLPELTAYVNGVGQKLAVVSDRKLPYEFVVLNNSVPNAWALPGGKIAVNRGLLYELKNEAELAAVLARKMDTVLARKYSDLLREELEIEAHSEIDEKSWRLKERLLRKPLNPKGNSKALESYFRQSLEDSATLYLHGLCCDIDVESGPRQLASRYIRRRLNVLREMLPPPEGVPLFPEEISETV